MNNKIKHIGIDARFYGPIGKGLGRYTQEIVDNIIKLDQANHYVIFLRQENYNDFVGTDKRIKKVLADIEWYGLKEQLIFPWLIWRERLDLMHFPHFNVPIFCPTKFIVTIHDLILIKFPTLRATTLGPWFYKIKKLAYKIVITMAVRRAKRIIAVSNFTKNDIIQQFKIKPAKIIVTYEGVKDLTLHPAFTPPMTGGARQAGQATLLPESYDGVKNRKGEQNPLNPPLPKGQSQKQDEILAKYNIKKPYLLYVGNAYPHKNLKGLIKIFQQLIIQISGGSTSNLEVEPPPNPDIQLVLVGKEDYFYTRLKSYAKSLDLWQENVSSPVIFPGYISDDNLAVLYRKALLYVFPSFYEGFGLPSLEAMANGCPVVSSNQTSLPEILGQAAIYFDPNNEDEMLKQIQNLINNKNLRQELVSRGYEQIKKYSWLECAKKTLEIYHQILRQN